MDTGEEKIEDQTAVFQLRRQARRVHIESLLAAALLTVLSLVISK